MSLYYFRCHEEYLNIAKDDLLLNGITVLFVQRDSWDTYKLIFDLDEEQEIILRLSGNIDLFHKT